MSIWSWPVEMQPAAARHRPVFILGTIGYIGHGTTAGPTIENHRECPKVELRMLGEYVFRAMLSAYWLIVLSMRKQGIDSR